MKPRIGITAFNDGTKPRHVYVSVNTNYTRSVALAGGLPLVLPVSRDPADVEASLDAVDGLLLSGGADLSPLRYGEEPIRGLGLVGEDRDEFELALVRLARERGIPLLAICRGHQLANVALGGTLYQDLAAQVPGSLLHDPREGQGFDELTHSIEILPARRRLDPEALPPGRGGLRLVNSFHHQAVKDLAPGLVAVARAADGVLEAYEAEGDWWLLGLQFHPEGLTLRHPSVLGLFRGLVAAAASRAGRS